MTAPRIRVIARGFAQRRSPATEGSSVCIHGGAGGRDDAESAPPRRWTATSGASHRHRQNSGHLNGSLNGSPVQEALEREVSRPGVCAVTKA